MLDSSYAQNILNNFSNYSLLKAQDYLKEIKISDVFHDTTEVRS